MRSENLFKQERYNRSLSADYALKSNASLFDDGCNERESQRS